MTSTNSPSSPPPTLKTIMGFDFGLQKIGIAIGQMVTKTATPLTIINAREGKPNWVLLDPVVAEWQPDLLVVGNPLNMDGSESELSLRAKKFSRRVAARYAIETVIMDERLSTRAARERADLDDHTGPVDAYAAAIIIENWLYHKAPQI